MGMLFSTLFNRLFGAKEHRILILGLDNAGKTTILYKLVTPDEVVRTMPTIGFNLESVTWKNVKLQVWDLGGQTNLRPYWRLYCKGIVSALIYVVDSADDERVNEARLALMTILEEEEMKSSALLVFANKQDLPGALSASQISEGLNLTSMRGRQWHICRASALSGEGIAEGLDWVVNAILEN